jgi:hypothetical protein
MDPSTASHVLGAACAVSIPSRAAPNAARKATPSTVTIRRFMIAILDRSLDAFLDRSLTTVSTFRR